MCAEGRKKGKKMGRGEEKRKRMRGEKTCDEGGRKEIRMKKRKKKG